jgi:hypothetical protein
MNKVEINLICMLIRENKNKETTTPATTFKRSNAKMKAKNSKYNLNQSFLIVSNQLTKLFDC